MDRYIINRRSPATPSPSNPNPSRATALERKPGWLEDLAKEIARKQRAKQGGPGNPEADLNIWPPACQNRPTRNPRNHCRSPTHRKVRAPRSTLRPSYRPRASRRETA